MGKGRDSQVRLVGAWRLCQRFPFMKALCFPRATSQSQTQASLGFPFRTCTHARVRQTLEARTGLEANYAPTAGLS